MHLLQVIFNVSLLYQNKCDIYFQDLLWSFQDIVYRLIDTTLIGIFSLVPSYIEIDIFAKLCH